ncbi:MAG TPA: hypothetical protein VK994_02075 [Bacteroidales bacterium]|nr:hypothetical protein [Bacteroidales bacterium]
MSEIKIIYLTGRTGKKYRFYTFPGPDSLKAEGGIYAITRRAFIDDAWEHEVLRIAETHNLSELKALMAQEGYDCEKGANCLAARLENNPIKRKRTAEDLWGNYFPAKLAIPA